MADSTLMGRNDGLQLEPPPKPASIVSEARAMLDAADPERERVVSLLLDTPEAVRVMGSISSKEQLAEFCRLDRELSDQLKRTGVSVQRVAERLYRDQWLTATLEEAVKHLVAPTAEEVREFYEKHRERWVTLKRWRLRHILITVQAQFADNTEDRARQRIADIHTRILAGEDFAELAVKNSECPTAVDGGLLGWVGKGQLYPQLERNMELLVAGGTTLPTRTELGWHLLRCEAIRQAGMQPLSEIEQELTQSLHQRARIAAQKQWVRAVCVRGQATATNAGGGHAN